MTFLNMKNYQLRTVFATLVELLTKKAYKNEVT